MAEVLDLDLRHPVGSTDRHVLEIGRLKNGEPQLPTVLLQLVRAVVEGLMNRNVDRLMASSR